MFQQYCINKASNGCYLFHVEGIEELSHIQ